MRLLCASICFGNPYLLFIIFSIRDIYLLRISDVLIYRLKGRPWEFDFLSCSNYLVVCIRIASGFSYIGKEMHLV